MKTTISEDRLNNLIRESIKQRLLEFDYMGGFDMFETEDDDDHKEKHHKKSHTNDNDDRKSDMNDETYDEKEKRDQVEDFFKKPGVNNAPYAYELYDVEPEQGKDTNDMKNARSQFEKDLSHAKNEKGYPYSFTSQEINQLQAMISSNQLSEAIDKAIKKILK